MAKFVKKENVVIVLDESHVSSLYIGTKNWRKTPEMSHKKCDTLDFVDKVR